MFDSLEQAREAAADFIPEEHLDEAMKVLVPGIGLRPGEPGAPVETGGSRLGGSPDLPAGSEWPRPTPSDDPEEIEGRANAASGTWLREHLSRHLPFAFLCQIDLAEAHALGELTADLPEHGRLLFFYDLCVGGWEQGDRPVHVRWDTTPVSELVSLEVPDDLVAAHEREHEEYLDRCRDFDKTPPRPCTGDHLLCACPPGDTVPGGVTPPGKEDPALEAFMDNPEDWRLLLQFSIPGWDAAEDGEGTVYFLINTDDLAARRFDRVQAIYQQT